MLRGGGGGGVSNKGSRSQVPAVGNISFDPIEPIPKLSSQLLYFLSVFSGQGDILAAKKYLTVIFLLPAVSNLG